MIEPKTLARPYAIAAYHFARAHHQLDAWNTMLANLRGIVLNDRIQSLLQTPALRTDVLLKMLTPVLEKSLDKHGMNFLKLLIENQRLLLAPVIFELFKTIKEEAENVTPIDVTTAIPLNTIEQNNLVESIVQRLKRKVLPSFHVDEALIAGVVIRVGEAYVIDGSLKTQFMRLKIQF